MTNQKTMVLAGAAVFAIVAAVYSPCVRNEFVRYDDYDYIVTNQAIASGVTPKSVWWAFRSAGYASNWHPLTWLSHALDNSLADALRFDWRDESNGPLVVAKCDSPLARLAHAENVLLHACNAVLLYLLMLALMRKGERHLSSVGVATVCALLWALHPLRTEVVAWAAERKELLSVFFLLLASLSYLKIENSTVHLHPKPTPYTLSFLSFSLALLAKPVAVTFPAVLFAYDWVLAKRDFRTSFSRIFPFVGLSAIACCLTMAAQTSALAYGSGWGWMTRILCAVEAPIIYCWQMVWPVGLSIHYLPSDWSSWPVFACGIAFVLTMAICIGLFVVRRRGLSDEGSRSWLDEVVFCIFWSYVGLVPMLGLVKVGNEPHSDRYTYWIGCGIAVTVCLAVSRLECRWHGLWRKILVGVVGIVLAAWTVLSVAQTALWRNTGTLFTDVIDRTHDESTAYVFGVDLSIRSEDGARRAEEMLRRVVAAKGTPMALGALALHLMTFGEDDQARVDEARALARQAIAADAKAVWALAALGFADFRDKRYPSAYENMRRACELGYQCAVADIDLKEWKRLADTDE